MSTVSTVKVTDALLPPPLIKLIENDEKAMMATALLVIQLMSQTIELAQIKQCPEFDAFPGDRLCHVRLTLLPEILEKPEVCEELTKLAEIVAFKQQTLKERRRTQPSPCQEFFEREIASLQVSHDVHFLMDCRLLKATRGAKFVEPNGIAHPMMDHGMLSKFSPKLHEIDSKYRTKFREQIALDACTRLSAETMTRFQEYSRKMKVSGLLQRMIEQVVVVQVENYPPKSFGCQFFTMQLALSYLLKEKIPMAIKTIIPPGSGEPRRIFFKAQENDYEFQDFEEARRLPKTSYVGIVQAFVPSEEALLAKIKEIGFIELILRYAAQEPPFHPASTLNDIKDQEARKLIEEYRMKAAESGCNKTLLQAPHTYLSTIQEEIR